MSTRWPDIAGRLEAGTHYLPIRVYYEDTDFSGIVYHANYLKFAERSRSDFLRLAGVHHHELLDLDPPLAFAIHRMEIDFVSPARIDDELEVQSRYTRASGARIEAQQQIVKLTGVEPAVIWRATVFAACLDPAGRPKRLPASVVEAMKPHLGAEPLF